jgi:hypothetical protein
VNAGVVAVAESFFFPLDVRLKLGTEGYSEQVLRKAIRLASKSPFHEASDDLWEVAGIEISTTHLQRLTQRIGTEWADERDRDVERFRAGKLERTHETHTEKPASKSVAAAVMIDGGRLQTRAADQEPGVYDPRWQETKAACCLTLASRETLLDPQPEPPSKFLVPTEAARLALEFKSRTRPADGRSDKSTDKSGTSTSKPSKRKRKKQKRRIQPLVRTVVATMADSEAFGWQMAAEVQRRGLDQFGRKACVCDGQRYNWTLFDLHLLAWGFVGILDFLHLLAYLYDAAHAWHGSDKAAGWKQYETWLRWAWSGKVGMLLKSLRCAAAELEAACGKEKGVKDYWEARLETVRETLGYVENNRTRMDYPGYRRRGLPISSAPVESAIKQLNRRVKSTEKFWLRTGAEALLQIRAAYLSGDDRVDRYWRRPRPHRRAAGEGRLARPTQAA